MQTHNRQYNIFSTCNFRYVSLVLTKCKGYRRKTNSKEKKNWNVLPPVYMIKYYFLYMVKESNDKKKFKRWASPEAIFHSHQVNLTNKKQEKNGSSFRKFCNTSLSHFFWYFLLFFFQCPSQIEYSEKKQTHHVFVCFQFCCSEEKSKHASSHSGHHFFAEPHTFSLG